MLEQHPPAPARPSARSASVQLSTSTPKTRIEPAAGPVEPDDRAQQHRLAGARAADDAEHLAAVDVEIEIVVDDLTAEAVDEAADLDDRLAMGQCCHGCVLARHQTFTSREEDREDRVEHDDEEDREHHRSRGQPPEALGVAFDLQPVVAADEADDEREERRLDDADEIVPDADIVGETDVEHAPATPRARSRPSSRRRSGRQDRRRRRGAAA